MEIFKLIKYHQHEENFWRIFSLQQFVQVFVSKLIWLTKIKELMKNVCRCVLIFTNIVKVSLLVAHCAQVHMCSAVTLSKSDLQLFIFNLHLGRCSYQLAAQTCLETESDNNKAKLAWKGPRDGPLISIWSGVCWLVWSFVDQHGQSDDFDFSYGLTGLCGPNKPWHDFEILQKKKK